MTRPSCSGVNPLYNMSISNGGLQRKRNFAKVPPILIDVAVRNIKEKTPMRVSVGPSIWNNQRCNVSKQGYDQGNVTIKFLGSWSGLSVLQPQQTPTRSPHNTQRSVDKLLLQGQESPPLDLHSVYTANPPCYLDAYILSDPHRLEKNKGTTPQLKVITE